MTNCSVEKIIPLKYMIERTSCDRDIRRFKISKQLLYRPCLDVIFAEILTAAEDGPGRDSSAFNELSFGMKIIALK